MERKPKFTGLGVALGAVLGAVFGLVVGHMGVWLAVGVAIGMAIGLTVRRREPQCPECAAIHRAHEARRSS